MEVPIEFKLFLYVIVVFSAVFHEYFHGWMAYYLGDPTAKYAGRLTLNPLKHLDPMGTVIIPLFLLFVFGGFIGWAKPVPYNPFNLRDQKWGSTKVGIAGPGANFLIALVFGLVLRLVPVTGFLYVAFSWVVYVNIFLGLFNLIPIPPLDGSKLLMDFFPQSRFLQVLQSSFIGIFLALFLAIMFLPPLAGFFYYLFAGHSFPGLIFGF
ncbi:MAG: site-2 protease family protein [Candidatus Nealsonbacteria bacterium]|nr:MAG: site-2 protease family protein [Candidatus Nealsonbacteria bacterium]